MTKEEVGANLTPLPSLLEEDATRNPSLLSSSLFYSNRTNILSSRLFAATVSMVFDDNAQRRSSENVQLLVENATFAVVLNAAKDETVLEHVASGGLTPCRRRLVSSSSSLSSTGSPWRWAMTRWLWVIFLCLSCVCFVLDKTVDLVAYAPVMILLATCCDIKKHAI